MELIYYSKSNNTKRFIDSLDTDLEKHNIDSEPKDNYILFTPTYNFGQIPEPVQNFLDKHSNKMIGVVSFGNRNWGSLFAVAGEKISDEYGVPLYCKLELSGTKKDKQKIEDIIRKVDSVG
ncbi:flavodoxin [Staphylococcus phage S-CoN_Ph2]|uniref:Uncharacterized protein n=1 Tax=Staphylococcus phage 6ec TaxID=1500386 RepID=A0A060ABA3_9CAUD|nr:flavodoxin [Staphylococcus phage 6ec]MDU6246471.1 class Ib ribonucleoside-diphosphate reductase assembly flavoprotein NrdI [Staphylococcus lugdunensis]MDU6254416.1 class Ib ribonucleoside-diphosphate reductase assembly flavoprotein NrdI [Staphylococcus warneri]WNM51422.1 flavodoxin [Staphylococcus phage S-CoN_Ph1]WNM51689.1 flavodoxin [Staphylococcus phage S-CoN_Ph2]WNM51851.1 flavodoxin [Staphylococcus phage S-CoN_Ph3]WNM51902.1 flavodoxin [Staphylococcus phage S-CoN_Ph4]WNM52085.1 flavo